jgi:hypothetical protein
VKHVGRRIARLLVVPSLVAAGLVATAPPAAANFHLMKIREVGPDVQGGQDFVELQMYSSGQDLVGGHNLTLYDSIGAPTTFTIPGNVTNGANQATILITTTGWVGPPTPDFATMPQWLTDSRGAVCFETIDCVEWGASEVPAVAADPPASPPMSGESLERTIAPGCPTLLESGDDTGSSDTDFSLQPTPNPEPNSATPNETPCAPGTVGGAPILKGLRAKVRGNRAIISGQVLPPAPGDRVSLTFFANGSPLHKVAKKNAVLNADSKFKKRFRIPSASTRCRVKVAFHGAQLGKKTFRC